MFKLGLLSVTYGQMIVEGPKKTVDLPLTNDISREERMKMTYWTSYKETKACLLDPYDCSLDEYEKWFEGELSLINVLATGWSP